MKLGIVGSREFTNENKVKVLLKCYIKQFGVDNLVIVSGGCPNGADFVAKKVALEMGLNYVEFPPVHFHHNEHCVNPPECYNKPYHVSNFFTRNTQIAEFCDHLVAFTVKGIKANGTMDTFGKAKKLGKKVILHEAVK